MTVTSTIDPKKKRSAETKAAPSAPAKARHGTAQGPGRSLSGARDQVLLPWL